MTAAPHRREGSRRITFEVVTRSPLPVGEQVFITGNQENLGDWAPDGFPLTRIDDNWWAGTALLPADRPVQYKITRGAWESEEARPDGIVPGNRTVEPGADAVAKNEVARWKDLADEAAPHITGDYRVHEAVHSGCLRFDRKVIVWLPPSYAKSRDRRYPVLYMQDGQQVFDPLTSTWKQDWEVDEWCERLIDEQKLQEIIVVGVYSTEDRFVEYNPSLAGAQYAQFLVQELKPFIDREYRTLPDRRTTAVAGSSLGATMAFYLAWTRPDVFFGAACLSAAFRFHNDAFDLDLVRHSAQAPDTKLYLYCGLGDATEQELAEGMQEMVTLLEDRGFARERNLVVREDAWARHNEAAWARVTGEWLQFLFGSP